MPLGPASEARRAGKKTHGTKVSKDWRPCYPCVVPRMVIAVCLPEEKGLPWCLSLQLQGDPGKGLKSTAVDWRTSCHRHPVEAEAIQLRMARIIAWESTDHNSLARANMKNSWDDAKFLWQKCTLYRHLSPRSGRVLPVDVHSQGIGCAGATGAKAHFSAVKMFQVAVLFAGHGDWVRLLIKMGVAGPLGCACHIQGQLMSMAPMPMLCVLPHASSTAARDEQVLESHGESVSPATAPSEGSHLIQPCGLLVSLNATRSHLAHPVASSPSARL